MGVAYDVGVNVAAAALGAGAGAGALHLGKRARERVNRSFWRFLERPTVFVVGDLSSTVLLSVLTDMLAEAGAEETRRKDLAAAIVERVDDQEISGLIGRGDFDAMTKLVARFASTRLPTNLLILRPSELTPAQRKQSLVLIGGRDVNSLTETMSQRLGCTLEATRNVEGRNIVRDRHLGNDFAVETTLLDARGTTRTVDYGILARARNPENRASEVVVIAGAHGYGTLAAAAVSVDREHQKRLLHELSENEGQFEALIRYERIDRGGAEGQPTIELAYWRRITPSNG